MSLDTDLRAKMVSLVGSTVPVQQNYLSADKVQPRVWYQRATGQMPVSVTGDTLVAETTYAIEVEGLDPDEASDVADLVTATWPAGLNGYRGMMGTTMVLGCFVEDAGDDFRFRGLGLDEGYHSIAFNLRILT